MVMPKMFGRPQTPTEKVYLSLLITDTSVQAGLWRVMDDLLSIDSLSQIIDYENEDGLLVGADQALQQLGPDSEKTDEVVFGFEFDWVTKTGLAEAKKPLLKRLTTELSLKSVGFVVVAEAVIQALRKQDQTLNGLLVQFAPHQLTVTLVRQGQPVISEQVGRSDNSVSDLTEALARFARTDLAKPLPGKIMLLGVGLDSRALAEQQQLLIEYDLAGEHEFLFPPVIEALPAETALKAVIAQGGRAVLKASGQQVNLDPELEEKGALVTTDGSDLESTPPVTTQSSFGVPIAPPPAAEPTPPSFNHKDQDLETAVDASVDAWQKPGQESRSPFLNDHESGVIVGSPLPETQTVASKGSAKSLTAKIRESVGALFGKLKDGKVSPTIATPDQARPPKFSPLQVVIASFIAGLLVLALAGLSYGYVSREATIKLDLNEEIISDDLVITLDPDAKSSDPASKVLRAQRVERQVSGSDQLTTTGAKLVGEKAQGVVTIFNKTEADKTFPSGTTLKSGSLEFTLDEEVRVASASVLETPSGDGATKTYGQAQVGVTATTIGAQANLAEGTELTIDAFSSSTYSASSKEAFTGGSSREIRVVASEDRTKLLSELRAQLMEEAAEIFDDDTHDGVFLLPTNQAEITKTEFSAEIGDETTILELSLTLTAYAVSYQDEDLKDLISQALAQQLQENYQLRLDQAQLLSSPVPMTADSLDSRAQIELNVRVPSIPELDEADLSQLIAGLSLTEASQRLADVPAIAAATIELTPAPLAFLMRSLPGDSSKIQFVFESEL